MAEGRMGEVLEQAVASGAVPGVVAVVVDADGVVFEGAAGRLHAGQDAPVRPDTVFSIMSMTKALVSVGALQLIEQGELRLDQPVAEILPAFGELQVLEGFDGDTPRLRPPASQATIRQLLTHTSGHGYFFTNEDLLRFHEVTGTPNLLTGQEACLHTPLVADPGTRWEYGISTDWLGRVLEAVSGQDLDAFVRERICEPLGMVDTTFAPTEEQHARRMAVHGRAPDGSLAVLDLALPSEPEFWSGGGGAFSTAQDYGRFLRALLRGGELDGARVLQEDTVRLAFSDQLDGLPLPEVVPTAVPELTLPVPALPVRQGWGLGFQLVLEDLPGMRRAGTGNWAGLLNSYYWVDHASGLAAAIFTQVLPFFDQRVVELALNFELAVYADARTAAPA